MNLRGVKALILFLLAFQAMASAQVHFTYTITSNNMTIAIPNSINPTVGGLPLQNGDEIGAFKPNGLCVGAVAWDGNSTAISVFGAEGPPTNLPGMANGETIGFKIWRAGQNKEFPATATFSMGDGIYTTGDIEIMSSLTAAAYSLTLAVLPLGAGTTTPAVGTYLYVPNEVVNISAAPTGSYVFNNWTGATVANPNSASTTITMDGNKSIVANFRIPSGTVGDKVWRDTNKNGIQDAGEPGLDGVTVNLYASGGTSPMATTTTSGGGAYSFANVLPGNYFVEFIALANYTITAKDQGANDAVDSDAAVANGRTDVFALAADEVKTTVDAGMYPQPATIGNFVWRDVNKNGIQDVNEPGLDGVTVQLYTAANALVGTTTTAGGGLYSFANVDPGSYYVKFTALANYNFSPIDQGGNDALDSDANVTTGQTAVTVLDPAETDNSWDAGMYPQPAAIGNFVWLDTDKDGIQDAGETGLNGVTVQLYTAANALVGTTATAGGGAYSFTNIEPGDYYVKFTALANYNFSPANAGGNDAVDSDADITTGQTAVTTLAAAETDNSWDAGMYPQPATIGNLVWSDTNKNGIQDAGEPGLNGVTVQLYTSVDALVATTTTAGGGLYSFANVNPGSYYVKYTLLANYIFSPANVGANDAVDSDADAAGKTATTTLDPAETDNNWDAGMYPAPATIGNFVWRDNDKDGIQDAGEPGLDGVTVQLYTAANALVGSTTTSGGGLYTFAPDPGDYYVKFTLPANYQFSPADQGGNDATDSDANTSTGQTIVTTLTEGENDLTWDAGMYPQPATIGNFVWRDVNKNGIQDVNEPGLDGVTVQLYTAANALVGTTTTAGGGLYSFANVDPGSYYVKFTALANYNFSPIDQGGNDALDSDANVTTGQTAVTVLDPAEIDNSWDAGMYPQPAAIGNFVWLDTDKDGIQDAGETGLNGVTVQLYTAANALVGTTATAGGGAYSFTNIEPGDYYVKFTALANYNFSPANAGGNDAVDSDADITTGQTAVTTLAAAETDNSWDAGMYPQPATIGNLVWSDTNKNGIQDAGEPGLNGVTVQLYTSVDALVATTTTAGGGLYSFANVNPGSYYVKYTLLANYIFSPANVGANDAVDSDADAAGKTATTTLDPAETDNNWDAGMYPAPATIGNFVWRDTNRNGIQDAGEPGLDGVTVQLYTAANALVGTTTTSGGGLYTFGPDPGDYYVKFTLPAGYQFSPANAGANDAVDSDANVTTGQTAVTTMTASENDLTWDAGMNLIPASVGDFVWTDINKNGIQDANEPGLDGVVVRLYASGATTPTATRTTAGGGAYSFTNVEPGDYFIEFVLPTSPTATYFFSPADQGGNDATDSDANVSTGRVPVFTLAPAAANSTVDAGIYSLKKVQVTITASTPGLQVSVDGTPHAAPYIFVSGETATHTILTTTPQELAGVRRAFVSWSDAGAISHSITIGKNDTIITANFTATHYFLTTIAQPPEGGTITPPPPGAWYLPGANVIVTAAPNQQWLFAGFTGDANNTVATTDTVTMTGPKSVTAHFVPLIPPKVQFFATPTAGNPALSVKFYDASEGNPTSWLWDFGDGQTSTEQNPVHVFWQPGKYSVTLTITTPVGVVSLEKEDFITVWGSAYCSSAWLDLIDNSMSHSSENWSNAIDHDVSGVDGTVTAGGPVAYAVFKFHDNKTKVVNKIRLMTNTDIGMEDRWVRSFDIYTSKTGLADADFSLLLRAAKKGGAWEDFACTPTQTKYVKLVLTSPNSGWRQLGEFEVQVVKDFPEVTKSTVTATTPHIANGVDASKMTITLKKSDGTAVTGLSADDFYLYSYSGSFAHTTILESTTPGVYTTSITTIEPGAKEIKVMVHCFVIGKATINFTAPVLTESRLLFVEGSTAWKGEGWDNAIDGDEDGWDGTATVGGTEPYAIFAFADNATKAIQSIALLTDTGVGYDARWIQRFRLQASTTGKSSSDFVTVYDGLAAGGDWQSFVFPAFKAKYFKLIIDFPKTTWRQLGELRVFTTTLPSMNQQANELTMIGTAPAEWSVSNNYPNPFNPETRVQFSVPQAGHVNVIIYNMLGQKVRTLINSEIQAGTHQVVWDSRSDAGEVMPSGIYYLRFDLGERLYTKKVVLTK